MVPVMVLMVAENVILGAMAMACSQHAAKPPPKSKLGKAIEVRRYGSAAEDKETQPARAMMTQKDSSVRRASRFVYAPFPG